MMRASKSDAFVVAAFVLALAVAAVRSREVTFVSAAAAQGARSVLVAEETRPAAAVARHRLRRSPFRLDGHLPDRRLGEPPVAPPPIVAVEPATVYAVTIKAIVGGPPWRALLAGLPGEAGDQVVAAGDRVGPVLIDSVGRARVRLSTSDTSWVIEWPQ
jgi:hypothetical protein